MYLLPQIQDVGNWTQIWNWKPSNAESMLQDLP